MTRRLFLLLALAGCSTSPGALHVSDWRGTTQQFVIADTPSLFIRAQYASTPGTHAQRIEIIDPDHALYATIEGDERVGDDGQVDNYGHVHVAGSPVEERSKTGRWTFRLVVDGALVDEVQAELR